MARLVPPLLGLFLLSRCGASNSLSGSLGQIFPLDFDSVTVLQNSESFQVSYGFTQFGNTDVVLQLTVALVGLDFGAGKTFDLSGVLPDGTPRTTVTHLSHGQAVLVLPPVQHGSLSIDSLNGPGNGASGSFSLSFAVTGALGSAYTVSGSFDQPLGDAGFPPDASYYQDAGPDAGSDGGLLANAASSGGRAGSASSSTGRGTSSGGRTSSGTASGGASTGSTSAGGSSAGASSSGASGSSSGSSGGRSSAASAGSSGGFSSATTGGSSANSGGSSANGGGSSAASSGSGSSQSGGGSSSTGSSGAAAPSTGGSGSSGAGNSTSASTG